MINEKQFLNKANNIILFSTKELQIKIKIGVITHINCTICRYLCHILNRYIID